MATKNEHGGKRANSGRKGKAEETKLALRLEPMSDDVHKNWHKAIKAGEPWAIKVYLEYYYGRPKQNMDVTTNGESINIPPIKWSE